MGRKKTAEVQTNTNDQEGANPRAGAEGEAPNTNDQEGANPRAGAEGEAPKTRKPRAIDVEALRTLADSHEDTEAAQLVITRLDAYQEALVAATEAQTVLEMAAAKVRKAAALLED
jgi:hypothetical protein